MKIYWLSMLVLASCLVGCSPSPGTKGQEVPPVFRMSVAPNDSLARFDLVLESEDTRPLCLSAEQWPNKKGELGGKSGQAKVVTHDGESPSRFKNFGYCAYTCEGWKITREKPLHGFIAYDQFASREPLATVVDKRLIFDAQPYVCVKDSHF